MASKQKNLIILLRWYMTRELCGSGSFSLIFSDHCGSSITELTESKLYTREDERMYTHTLTLLDLHHLFFYSSFGELGKGCHFDELVV